MSHRLAVQIWLSLLILGLLVAKGTSILPLDITSTQVDGKLSYELHTALQDWKTQASELPTAPPVVAIVVTLNSVATDADLELLRSTAETVSIQGAFRRTATVPLAVGTTPPTGPHSI